MQLGDPGSKKSKQIIRGIILFFILLFVVAFRKEIGFIVNSIIRFPNAPERSPDTLPPDAFLYFNCLFGFFFIFLFWNALLSFQALLPISDFLREPFQSLVEAYRTSWHLLLHIIGWHGPAIAVINGKANTTPDDEKRIGYPGVIVIDFNSAVVLEERHLTPGVNWLISRLLASIQRVFFLADATESPRVVGPGIVFTHPRERIRGTVDLRKQFRMDFKVRCYTREGIELYANIFSVFTVGQHPDILQVTYFGEMRPENLRVVILENRPDNIKRVKDFVDDLDEADRNEIHEFALRANQAQAQDPSVFSLFTPLPDVNNQVFDPERVFLAVYAQARNAKQEVVPWDELPVRVAASLYREQLLQINFDDLYDIRREKTEFPLWAYKGKLRLAMRNNGILAFRVVQHISGNPLIKGRFYRDAELLVSQIRELTNSKILRDRGIKIIFSSFGDLVPVNETIYKQRFDTWQTPWEKEKEISLANFELEAMRVRSRAHIEAQQDLWRSLRQLFDQGDYTEEALALRILQALDQAATDPKTRVLLPANTVDMMRHLQTLLLPPEPPPQPVRQPPAGGGGAP